VSSFPFRGGISSCPILLVRFNQFLEAFPATRQVYQDALHDTRLRQITHWSYKRRKGRFLLVESVLQHLLDDEHGDERTRRTLIDTIFDTEQVKQLVPAIQNASAGEGVTSGLWQSLTSSAKAWFSGESNIEAKIRTTINNGEGMDDSVFLPRIAALANLEPLLVERVADMTRIASKQLCEVVDQKVSSVLSRIKNIQKDHLQRAHEQGLSQARSDAVRFAQDVFLASTQDTFVNDMRYVWLLDVRENIQLISPATYSLCKTSRSLNVEHGTRITILTRLAAAVRLSRMIWWFCADDCHRSNIRRVWVKATAEAATPCSQDARIPTHGRRQAAPTA
jgi:hypothetical protein